MAKKEKIPVVVVATVQPVDVPPGQVPAMLSPLQNTPPHAYEQVDEDGIGQGEFQDGFEETEDEVGEEFEGPEAEDEEGKIENEEYEIENEEKTEDSVEEKFLNKETSTEDKPETLADSKKKDKQCPSQTETFVEEGILTGEENQKEGKSSKDCEEDGTLKRKRQEGSSDFVEASDKLKLSSKKRRNDQMSNFDESAVTKDMQEDPVKKKIGSAIECDNNKDIL